LPSAFRAPCVGHLPGGPPTLPTAEPPAWQTVDGATTPPFGSVSTWVPVWAFIPSDFLINVSRRLGPWPPLSGLRAPRRITESPDALLHFRCYVPRHFWIAALIVKVVFLTNPKRYLRQDGGLENVLGTNEQDAGAVEGKAGGGDEARKDFAVEPGLLGEEAEGSHPHLLV